MVVGLPDPDTATVRDDWDDKAAPLDGTDDVRGVAIGGMGGTAVATIAVACPPGLLPETLSGA